MLTFHASMPALSPAALHRLDLSHSLLLAILGGTAAWLFGPGLPPAVLSFSGVLLAAHLAGEVALRRWARRHAIPFIPRREWRAAWHRASDVKLMLAYALLFGVALVQVTQGRPVWALRPWDWAGAAAMASVMLLARLSERHRWTADA